MNTHNQTATPVQPQQALNTLCRLSQSLLDIAEQESQALIQNDLLAFAVLQDEKERLSLNYLDASQDFRNRINVFRRLDHKMLDRLESLQEKLSERTNDNNKLINQIRQNAEHFVTAGMKTAKEFGQSARTRLAAKPQNNVGITDTTQTAGA